MSTKQLLTNANARAWHKLSTSQLRTSRVKVFVMEIFINVDFEKGFQFGKGDYMLAMEGDMKRR